MFRLSADDSAIRQSDGTVVIYLTVHHSVLDTLDIEPW
jgi:hypothetical protein